MDSPSSRPPDIANFADPWFIGVKESRWSMLRCNVTVGPVCHMRNVHAAPASGSAQLPNGEHVNELHQRCAVYTRAPVAENLLDRIGWRSDVDLTNGVLLEPSSGKGAFLRPAVRRLVQSLRRYGEHNVPYDLLADRIRAWEIHPDTAAMCQNLVSAELSACGFNDTFSRKLATRWVQAGDFLLQDKTVPRPTHVVGNPPYVRWSRIPSALRREYERVLPQDAARGDLSLAFLHACLEALPPGGTVGFVISDRCLLMGYAEAFRIRSNRTVRIKSCVKLNEAQAFEQPVDIYPVELILEKTQGTPRRPNDWCGWQDLSAKKLYQSWVDKWPTLETSGYSIRVGPALGLEQAYVVGVDALNEIEAERRRPYVGPRELRGPGIDWAGRHVGCTYHNDGTLIDLEKYPAYCARLKRYRKELGARAIARQSGVWYRTIDRVRAVDWARPKLLVPELTNNPRIAIDRNGMIPSHGIYAIFAPDDNVDLLYALISGEVLSTTLRAIAPRAKSGSYRCYKRILSKVPLVGHSWIGSSR